MSPNICLCGCGTTIPAISKSGVPQRFVHGHNGGGTATQFRKGQEPWNRGLPAPWATRTHKGVTRSPETKARIGAAQRARREREGGRKICAVEDCGRFVVGNGFCYKHYARWKHHGTPMLMDRTGPNNHFYGKTHTPETRAKLASRRGPLHQGWRGGVGYLPYGPEFRRKLRTLIRERDGHRCMRCGKTQAEEGRTLQVHHLDHDKMNNDPSNLATSCASCNVWASYHRDVPWLGMLMGDHRS